MNGFGLNGAALNGSRRTATQTFPTVTTGITFDVGEHNMAPISGSTGITFVVNGQAGPFIQFPPSTIGIQFNLNGDALFANRQLVGSTGITFSHSATLTRVIALIGSSGITFSHQAVLYVYVRLGGTTGITFIPSGQVSALIRLTGAGSIAFTVTGDMSLNISDEDPEDRTFRRPFTTKEFFR